MTLRPIPECPGYHASEDGEIYSTRGRSGAPRRLAKFDRGTIHGYASPYLSVHATRNGRPCNRFVHELVLIAWVGPRPGTPDEVEACHGPGGSRDNRISNLRWDSVASNTRDRSLHRAACYGSGYSDAPPESVRPTLPAHFVDDYANGGHAFSDLIGAE